MELMLFRIVIFTLLLLILGGLAVVMISFGLRKKKKLWWISGALLLPIAFVGIFLLIAHELEKFTGERAEWRFLFKPSAFKSYPKNGQALDSVLISEWPLVYFPFGTEGTDSLPCYYSSAFEENSILITRGTGSFTRNESEASFRIDIKLNEPFKGELVFENRNRAGELLSRNAVYVMEMKPIEMSIEFRLNDFHHLAGNYLLLNYHLYE
jgi:hypothetical protein